MWHIKCKCRSTWLICIRMTSKLCALSLPSVAHEVLVIVNVIHLHDFRYESIDKEGKTSNTKAIEYYVTCYVHCKIVLSLDDYLVCLSCKNKVQPVDESSGICASCGVSQKLSFCNRQLRAKLLFTCPGEEYIQLSVFGDHLKEICGHDTVTRDKLIQGSPFNFTYNQQVINSVSQPTWYDWAYSQLSQTHQTQSCTFLLHIKYNYYLSSAAYTHFNNNHCQLSARPKPCSACS